jgi:lipoic acid synthetase
MTKSGIMLGIGETEDEVYAVMDDLLKAQCDVLVIGQYLRPWHVNIPVERFVTPREFEHFRAVGEAKGFKRVISGPFARTSYGAEDVFKSVDGIAGSGHSKTEESPANADSIIRNEHKKMYWRMS